MDEIIEKTGEMLDKNNITVNGLKIKQNRYNGKF